MLHTIGLACSTSSFLLFLLLLFTCVGDINCGVNSAEMSDVFIGDNEFSVKILFSNYSNLVLIFLSPRQLCSLGPEETNADQPDVIVI